MASRLQLIHLTPGRYDSTVHSGPEVNEHQSQNEHTSKYPSQIDALYQMKSPSEKRENSIIR